MDIYPPLETSDSIRLISLLPGPFHSDLELALITYSPAEAPSYEALSYTWGDASSQITVLINGEPASIRTNLDIALRHLRDEEESRTLWVDAVCINQRDVLERSQQVNRMRYIYSGAQHTIIWMGEEGDDSDWVFRAVDVMSKDTDPQRNGLLLRYIHGPGTFDDQQRIARFMSRPWWYRMWVLQEIVVSRTATVRCGQGSLPWSSFEAIWTAFVPFQVLSSSLAASGALGSTATSQQISRSNHIAIIRSLREQRRSGNQLNLLSLVVKYRRNRVTDPRDKIFALLGLAQSVDQDAFKADYSKTTAQVYSEFLKMVMETQKRVDILAFCNMHRKTPDLPSWVPDWSCSCHLDHELPLGYDALEIEFSGKRMPYRASGSKDADVRFSDDLKILITKGIPICSVQTLGKEGSIEQRPDGVILPNGYALPIAELVSLAEQATALETTEARQMALFRVLIADRLPTGAQPTKADWEKYQRLLEHSTDGLLWMTEHLMESMEEGRTDFTPSADLLNAISRTMRNRRLFISNGGHLGVAPSQVHESDLVCVLFGGATPFAIRPHEGRFLLIGEVYIWHPKFMEGDVVDQKLVDAQYSFELV